MVICLERRADLHMSQLMPLPLADSCFSKIQIGFTFLVSAHLDSPGQSAVKRMCVCVCVPIWRSPPSWIFKNSKFYRSVSSSHSLHKLLVLNFKFYKVLEQCSECDSVTRTQRVFLGVCRNLFLKIGLHLHRLLPKIKRIVFYWNTQTPWNTTEAKGSFRQLL